MFHLFIPSYPLTFNLSAFLPVILKSFLSSGHLCVCFYDYYLLSCLWVSFSFFPFYFCELLKKIFMEIKKKIRTSNNICAQEWPHPLLHEATRPEVELGLVSVVGLVCFNSSRLQVFWGWNQDISFDSAWALRTNRSFLSCAGSLLDLQPDLLAWRSLFAHESKSLPSGSGDGIFRPCCSAPQPPRGGASSLSEDPRWAEWRLSDLCLSPRLW